MSLKKYSKTLLRQLLSTPDWTIGGGYVCTAVVPCVKIIKIYFQVICLDCSLTWTDRGFSSTLTANHFQHTVKYLNMQS